MALSVAPFLLAMFIPLLLGQSKKPELCSIEGLEFASFKAMRTESTYFAVRLGHALSDAENFLRLMMRRW
jgi:hypothetical protein